MKDCNKAGDKAFDCLFEKRPPCPIEEKCKEIILKKLCLG